ncbi:maltose regulon regulatory protein [Rahnella aquatilis CIP 78.65 = ATCC 33071]|nr:substrate-binding domain-containing protein [Rahnella aquatilis]KFD11578.1 maltose regulon regulatory protein [Rahnella aquatilis CIP 78.65 = ATCC 33071]
MEDAPESELTEPPLTSIANSAREIGHATARRLLLRIGGQNLEAQNIIVPPGLVERESA